MKTLIPSFLAVLAIAAACSDAPEIIEEIADGRAKPPTPEQRFEIDTRNLDKTGQALACNHVYKLLGDSCVLKLDAQLQPRINYGTIIIDSTNAHLVELWVFEKGKASLTNLCTDVIVQTPGKKTVVPIRIHPQNGSIQMAEERSVEKSDGITYEVPVRSVLIRNLTFQDRSGKTIVLKDELIWKVKDAGTPG